MRMRAIFTVLFRPRDGMLELERREPVPEPFVSEGIMLEMTKEGHRTQRMKVLHSDITKLKKVVATYERLRDGHLADPEEGGRCDSEPRGDGDLTYCALIAGNEEPEWPSPIELRAEGPRLALDPRAAVRGL